MALRYAMVVGVAIAAMAAPPVGAQTPATPPSQPAAAPSGPVYVVSYFEVAPAASRKTAGLLRQFASTTSKENGITESFVLHQIARPGHFAVVEAWRDKAALDAHGAATKTLTEKLQASITSPFETREFVPFDVAEKPPAAAPGQLYVLTHVDVFPTHKDEVAALVKQQVQASRKDGGMLRFDALLWDGHPNHFHLIEAWSNRGAFEAYALAEHTKEFRAKVAPFEGAFYDERLYEPLR